jgi:hypothetical protein
MLSIGPSFPLLNSRGVAHALVFAGDPVGKRVPFPSHLEWSIREVVNVDILTDQLIRQLTPLQDDLPAILGERELLPHMALLTVAQNISEARSLNVEPAVHVLSLGGGYCELLVVLLDEPREEDVVGRHVADACETKLLQQTILQRAVRWYLLHTACQELGQPYPIDGSRIDIECRLLPYRQGAYVGNVCNKRRRKLALKSKVVALDVTSADLFGEGISRDVIRQCYLTLIDVRQCDRGYTCGELVATV